MKTKARQTHRLFVRVEDTSRQKLPDGKLFVKWVEVTEVNLGSEKIPNNAIFEAKFEPIKYEKEEKKSRGKIRNLFDTED